MGAVRLIGFLMWLGFYLGTIDCLIDAVKFMRKEAIHAQQVGPMSYGKFSRMLTVTDTPHKKRRP